MKKTISTYFPEGLEGNGIFTAISQITWFPNVQPAALDTYFMLKHGEKLASKVCDKYADDEGHITGNKLNALANVIHSAYITNWEHEYKTLTVEYNPIENTDFIETIKDKTHKDTEGNNVTTGKMTVGNTSTTTGEYTTTNETNVAGFDSTVNVPAADSSATANYGTDQGNPLTVSYESTSDYGTKDGTPLTVDNTGSEDVTYEREYKKHGNIGITEVSTMMQHDIDVWQLNKFYDILCMDICKIIALSIY